MTIFSLSSRRGTHIIALILFLSGLSLLFVGPQLPDRWGGLNISEAVSEIGTFITASVAVHWIFDLNARQELMSDIAKFTIGNAKVSNSGICDFVGDTKQIDYDDILDCHDELLIGLHYNPRFIGDYKEALEKRARDGFVTKVAIVSNNGEAMNFLRNVRKESDHINPDWQKTHNIISDINRAAKCPIEIYHHDVVLRYSFVSGGGQTWLKYYRNTTGIKKVCGIRIRKDTIMYNFIDDDIKQLFREAKRHA